MKRDRWKPMERQTFSANCLLRVWWWRLAGSPRSLLYVSPVSRRLNSTTCSSTVGLGGCRGMSLSVCTTGEEGLCDGVVLSVRQWNDERVHSLDSPPPLERWRLLPARYHLHRSLLGGWVHVQKKKKKDSWFISSGCELNPSARVVTDGRMD